VATIERIDAHRDRGDYKGARRLLRQRLKQGPAAHALMNRMAQAYDEEEKHILALRWYRRSIAVRPTCPLTLWEYAAVNWALGRRATALKVWEGLIKRGTRAASCGPCSLSLAQARALVTDCHLMVAWYHEAQGMLRDAIRKYRVHLKRRESGSGSIFILRETRQELRRLEAWAEWYSKHPETGTRPGRQAWRGFAQHGRGVA
jgi:tetratricopeptide (TPR) repeat protein